MAGAEGLEPSTKVLETHVLPLHHAPMSLAIPANKGYYTGIARKCQENSPAAQRENFKINTLPSVDARFPGIALRRVHTGTEK